MESLFARELRPRSASNPRVPHQDQTLQDARLQFEWGGFEGHVQFGGHRFERK